MGLAEVFSRFVRMAATQGDEGVEAKYNVALLLSTGANVLSVHVERNCEMGSAI